MKRLASIVLLFIIITLISCSNETRQAQTGQTSLDLISAYRAANLLKDTSVVPINEQLTYYHLFQGWSFLPGNTIEQNEFIIAAAGETKLKFDVASPSPRWLTLKFALDGPLGSLSSQKITASLNGRKLREITFENKGWNQFKVFLPARLQNIGANEISFKFAQGLESKGGQLNIYGYFKDLLFLFGQKNEADTKKTFRQEHLSQILEGRQLLQYCNSSLSYGFQLGQAPSISFSGFLTSNGKKDMNLSIQLNYRTDSQQQWQTLETVTAAVKAGQDVEVNFTHDLSALKNTMVELEFRVNSPKPFVKAGLRWKEAKISDISFISNRSNPADGLTAPDNIVLIILDASRADAYGYLGKHQEVTPYINQFAKSAVKFTNATSPTSFTGSSVASMMTGMSPEAHGFLQPTHLFPQELVTFPELLQEKGFYNAIFTGNPIVLEKTGLAQGFDQENVVYPRELFAKTKMWHDENLILKRIAEISKVDRKKFFYFHLMPPHYPYDPPAPFNTRFHTGKLMNNDEYVKVDEGLMAGTVSPDDPRIREHHLLYHNNLYYGDHLVETILEELKKKGLYDNSLIIITADHAEAFGEHRTVKHYKTVYEEMIHVPMMIKMPGIKPATISSQVGLEDIFATINELYQIDYQSPALRSSSLLAFLKSGKDDPNPRQYYRRASVNYPFYSLRGDTFKYLRNRFSDELYNLEEDPGELHNLAAHMPARMSTMRTAALLLKLQDEKLGTSLKMGKQKDSELEEDLKNLGYLH